MPAPTPLDVVCREGILLPLPGGVYFHPGQTRASVDLMALVRAMNAAPRTTGRPIFVPETALDDTAMRSLGRALSQLEQSPDLVLVPIPGERLDPDAWLRAAETAGIAAHLPPEAGPVSDTARIVPVGADHRETGGAPVALRVLPRADVSARELLRAAALLAGDDTTTPLQRVRRLGATSSAAYPLAVGMVLTGSTAGWDPARLAAPSTGEIWDAFRADRPAPDDLARALPATPGSAALVRVSGLGGDRLTWLFADGGTIWQAGPDVVPASAALLARVGTPGTSVAFLDATDTVAPGDAPGMSVPQIMISSDDPVMPDPVGRLRAGMDQAAPAHPVFGPDYFGARRQAPVPAFARPLGGIRTGQLDAFFRRLDLTGRAGPVSLNGLPETGTVLRNTAGEQMPLHVPMIWVGSAVSPDNPSAAAFMAGAAQQARALAAEGYFTTLWVSEPPTAAGLEWAREHGIRVIRIQDVYHAAHPVDDEFLVHLAGHTADGYTAAADVLRWRIIDDFGGFYSDGDNAIEDAAVFAAEVRSLFAAHGWAIHEAAAGRDGKRRINNSGILGARHHPAIRAFRDLIADNHATAQATLMEPVWAAFTGYAGGVEVAAHRTMDMLRKPLLWTAGPQILDQIGDRLLARHRTVDGALPRLRAVHMGHAGSWYRADPLAPVRSFTEAERPAVLAGLATVLVWQLRFRGGDLYLPAVAPVVAGFSDPAAVWRELLEPFLTESWLRARVRTVTDRVMVGDPGGGASVRQVDLPGDLRTAWGLDGTASGTWQLGELMRPAEPAEIPALRWTDSTEPDPADGVHQKSRLAGPARPEDGGARRTPPAGGDLHIFPALVEQPGPEAIRALLHRDLREVLDDALFAVRMATPAVDGLTVTDPDVGRAWARASAALAGLRDLPEPDAWSRLPGLGVEATLRRIARLVPDETHPAVRPLLALDAVLRTGVFPDRTWPAAEPVHRLGGWTTQPRSILASVDAHAARAGRPVIAVDLSGPPEAVTPVLDRLRELLRWYGRIGPAPLVVGSRATAYGLKLFARVRAEQRPVTLTTEPAGPGEAWRLRDTDGDTVGDLAATPGRELFQAAGALPHHSVGPPAALREWLNTFDPVPAEAYHRRNWERLHDPAVATALDRLAEAHPDDPRLAVFRTALAVARRAGGPVPATGPRPAAVSTLDVEPPWNPERGRVPVTVVYDYLRAGADRRARAPWDGLLFALMLAGEMTDAQVLSLLRATAVTGHDLASLTMMTVISELRSLPDDTDLLDADPLIHPRLRSIFDRIAGITKGGRDGSYRDCLSPVDRVAWIGRLDAYAKTLAASADPFQRLRAEQIAVITYAVSNC